MFNRLKYKISNIKTFVVRKARSGYIVLCAVLGLFCLLTGLTYGIFMISTNKYRATDMLISDAYYTISLRDTDGTASISNQSVTVAANTTEIIEVTVTSVNPINTNYRLQYAVSSGSATVKYDNSTGWLPYGYMNNYNESIHSKKIKIAIENNSASVSTVNINVTGGYTFNSVGSIKLLNGYTAITNSYNSLASKVATLYEIAEDDTLCDTSTLNTCLYGGEAINNYVQYPTNANKSLNIWRILGTYEFTNGETVTKLISTTRNTSAYSSATSTLNSFKATLTDNDLYLYTTNKFLCTGLSNSVTCNTSSTFTNSIGLINASEYTSIGGVDSFLNSTISNDYYTMTAGTIGMYKITPSGLVDTASSNSSGIRATIYIANGTMVDGTGTSADPYTIVEPDVIISSWTINGVASSVFPSSSSNLKGIVNCTNGVTGQWNTSTWALELSNTANLPTRCTIAFDNSLRASFLSDNTIQTNSIDFNSFSSATNGEGLYEYSENGTPIYYFRGTHSLKNNVIFAGYCWKIIRTTALGNVRMIYNGVSNASNQCLTTTGSNARLQSSKFNSTNSYNAFVGYTYGTPNSTTFEAEHYGNTSSTIKTVVDAWYNGTGVYTSLTNKLVDYSSYLAPDGFCADRSFASSNTGTGYGSSDTYYGAYDRIVYQSTKTPSLSCGVNDLANINIGLITADEVLLAGCINSNTNSYLYSNTSYWTMSPLRYYAYTGSPQVYYVTSSGALVGVSTTASSTYIRPVIALKSNVTVTTGDGSQNTPYIITTD